MKWVDHLREIYEQQIWDPIYEVLDTDIHIHFAQYLKDILQPRIIFDDRKILLDGKKEITHIYLFCFFQIKVLREIFDETIALENILKGYEEALDKLRDPEIVNSRTMSDITYIRKKTEKARGISILKSKTSEININLMLLREFKDHIKTKLDKPEKVENVVNSIFIINEFEKFESTLIDFDKEVIEEIKNTISLKEVIEIKQKVSKDIGNLVDKELKV